MPGTFTQIYIQIVFAVKFRHKLIHPSWKEELNKYIAGIINAKGQKPIIVNGASDHIHVFIGFRPSMLLSDLVRDIKNNSSKFINEQGWIRQKFRWQEGYGAFSYSQSHMKRVYNYILNQDEHHRKKSFHEEYLEFLKEYEIEYDEKYVFDINE